MQYNTGYSNQPIDFSRASQAMLNSALQMKVQEVKQRKDELSEAQKYMLKVMDLETIPELSGVVRQRFDDEIKKLRDKTIGIVEAKKGALTSYDKAEIEKGAVSLQNRMNRDKLTLEQFTKIRDYAVNPRYKDSINQELFSEDLGRKVEHWEKTGEDIGSDIVAMPFDAKYKIIKPLDQRLDEHLAGEVKNNKIGASGKIENQAGDKYTIVKGFDQQDTYNSIGKFMDSDKEARQLYTTIKDGKEIIDPNKRNEVILAQMQNRMKPSKEERFDPGTGNKGILGIVMKQEGQTISLGGQDYKAYAFPEAASGKLNFQGVDNPDTGEKENVNEFSTITVSHILTSPGKIPKILVGVDGLETKMKRGGEQVYAASEYLAGINKPNDPGAFTEKDIANGGMNNDFQTTITAKYPNFKIEGNPKTEQKKDGLKVTVRASDPAKWRAKSNNGLFSKNKPIEEEFTLSNVPDYKSPAPRTIDLTENVINKLPAKTRGAKVEFEGKIMRWEDQARILMQRGAQQTNIKTESKAEKPKSSQGSKNNWEEFKEK